MMLPSKNPIDFSRGSVKIIIDIPKDYDKETQTEIYNMLKLLCDNIGTDGISCRKSRLK